MNTLLAGFTLMLLATGAVGEVALQDLETLSCYEGHWESTFSIEANQEGGQPTPFTGVVEGTRVLDGKFMEQTGTYTPVAGGGSFTIKTMMTWDEQLKRFRYDYFTSAGQTYRSYGSWDAASKTMTSTMIADDNGDTTTIVADFSVDGKESWSIETRNRGGELKTRIAGTNTRKKTDQN